MWHWMTLLNHSTFKTSNISALDLCSLVSLCWVTWFSSHPWCMSSQNDKSSLKNSYQNCLRLKSSLERKERLELHPSTDGSRQRNLIAISIVTTVANNLIEIKARSSFAEAQVMAGSGGPQAQDELQLLVLISSSPHALPPSRTPVLSQLRRWHHLRVKSWPQTFFLILNCMWPD